MRNKTTFRLRVVCRMGGSEWTANYTGLALSLTQAKEDCREFFKERIAPAEIIRMYPVKEFGSFGQ